MFSSRNVKKMIGPTVELLDGLVRGKVCFTATDKSYYSFTGVPYAEPPISKMRFREAVPNGKWDGILDCTRDDLAYTQFNFYRRACVGTEELIVNVYTPQLPCEQTEPLPVMIYLHGGGLKNGTSSKPELNPDYILDRGVVVIGIQSRLCIYGFLCLDIPEVPGNNGLKDQTLAMKWVKNNIDAFGGDPNNVCIYGSSSGATQVEMHMLSPLSNGLFHKMIASSSSSINPWALCEDPIDLAFKVGKKLGYNGTDKYELLKLFEDTPSEHLTMEVRELKQQQTSKKGGFTFMFAPVIEKSFAEVPCFLESHAIDLLQSGRFSKLPYMIGISSREGGTFNKLHPDKIAKAASSRDLFSYLPFEIKEDRKVAIASRIEEVYEIEKLEAAETVPESVIDFFGDADLAAGIIVSAKLVAKHNPNVYLFCFGYDGNFNLTKKKLNMVHKGATHGDQDSYILGSNFDTEHAVPTDYLVQDRMLRIFTNFMKFGNPTPELCQLIDTCWETLDPERMNYMDITENLRMEEDLLGERRRLWEDIYFGAWERDSKHNN